MQFKTNHDGHQAARNPALHESTEFDPSSVLIRGFSTREAAKYLGISESYLKSARKKNPPPGVVGPKFTKIGSKIIYLREDLNAHLTKAKEAFYSV